MASMVLQGLSVRVFGHHAVALCIGAEGDVAGATSCPIVAGIRVLSQSPGGVAAGPRPGAIASI
ncbi:hypothetical protein [Sphingomonas sp. PP-CE-1G-424]|uniref:hypothetical protein n=1 Tax=Sphingomonas sp. PP-CE-1G-424 TaxID=2135658 RepID=UPI00105494FE|nr:hypothetical protein [Sphingomonas sp. PP-CE-1G-424]